MADFYAPQFHNPDILRSMALGQQIGQQASMGPGDLQGQQLSLEQMRQTMQKQGMLLDTANQIGNLGAPQQQAPAGQQGAPPMSGDPLGDVMNDKRNALYQKMDMLAGREPFATQKAAETNRLEQLGLQLQGPINLAQRLQADPQANIVVAKNPQLKQMWNQWAAARGMNPDDPMNLTLSNAQMAARDYEGTLQAQLGKPATGGFTGTLKPGEAAYQGGQQVAGDPNGMTADQRATLDISRGHLDIDREKLKLQQANQGAFTPEMGELAAALAERGVSLPSGFRAKQQQATLYSGLLSRHPGMSVDDLADLVKSGKISLAGDMKEQTTAGGIVGKVKYAENELTQSIPLALDSSSKVPRGSFIPFSRLMQMADTSISDPALVDLKIKTQSVLNAYDMLAARSGTDVGKREASHRLLESAQSPEAYQTALKAMAQEAQVAHKAGDLSMGRTPSGAAPITKTIGGATYVQRDGKWYHQ